MKRLVTILLIILLTQNFCVAQFRKQIDSLTDLSNKITSDAEKVAVLDKLADLYYTFKLNKQGDSVLKQQLLIADLSNNNVLILKALFSDAISNISDAASAESFDKIVTFIQKGINYAKSKNQYDYIALGYSRMANILRKKGQNDKSLYEATQALQFLPNISSDSIKTIIYIELGNSYVARGEAVSAVRNYNHAFDIAVKIKSITLQSNIYHCFSEMYFVFLKNKDVAKEFVIKSLQLNKEHNYVEGLIKDYFALYRITDEKSYLEKAISMSETFHVYKYVLQSKILMFYYYMIVDKNTDKALSYLEGEPDVKESYKNLGPGNYYQTVGHIYYYGNKFDSAKVYYKLAELDFEKNFDEKRSRALLKQIAGTYNKLNDLSNATTYYLKALTLSQKANDAKSVAEVSQNLSDLYEQQGEYKQAISFSRQAKRFNDSLGELSKARDIALLDVDRENRKHAEELRQEEQKLNYKRNIQYMAITISIGVVFIIMLIIGMFPVSKLTIKILGYIFFISLFEFIVLLIDTFLHKITHGEPLKIWLIKIVLIAMLVPLQHSLEHRLIKFLESRKLLKARTNFSIKKWWQKMKKPDPVKEAGFQEGTAVL